MGHNSKVTANNSVKVTSLTQCPDHYNHGQYGVQFDNLHKMLNFLQHIAESELQSHPVILSGCKCVEARFLHCFVSQVCCKRANYQPLKFSGQCQC